MMHKRNWLLLTAVVGASLWAQNPGVQRTVVKRGDTTVPGREAIIARVELAPGASVGRHTHPGIESSYVLEGGFELPVQGQPTRMLKAGDGFQIPPETPHAGGKASNEKCRLMINYIVQKGKPLATPV